MRYAISQSPPPFKSIFATRLGVDAFNEPSQLLQQKVELGVIEMANPKSVSTNFMLQFCKETHFIAFGKNVDQLINYTNLSGEMGSALANDKYITYFNSLRLRADEALEQVFEALPQTPEEVRARPNEKWTLQQQKELKIELAEHARSTFSVYRSPAARIQKLLVAVPGEAREKRRIRNREVETPIEVKRVRK